MLYPNEPWETEGGKHSLLHEVTRALMCSDLEGYLYELFGVLHKGDLSLLPIQLFGHLYVLAEAHGCMCVSMLSHV